VSFEEMIRKASETNRSRIVLALDVEDPDRDTLLRKSTRILREAGKYTCAVKINRQLVLALGLRDGVDIVVKMAHELSLPAIMDAKLNDVSHTNEFMMRSYADAGFDAVIVSPVAGWEGGLDSVFRLANSRGKAVILLVYMSNPGADALYSLMTTPAMGKPRPVYELFAEMAVEWKANGVVVGATKPEIITKVRELAGGNMAIFSPGVGAQGGDARRAIEAGSDYLIVGRSIYGDANPSAAAGRYRDMLM
jgi:orotidine-5'-phosphate decarboxylase